MNEKIRGKNVLVTGADGFIGSHLCELLLQEGARVRALNFYNSFGSRGWLDDVKGAEDIEIVSGDIRDSAFCIQLTKGIDIVFNLAALIAIPYSYIAPESYIDTNVKGALNVCQASRLNGVGRVVQISTSEVYGTARYVPINEDHPLQPQSPYSASKIGSDAVAMSFYHAFDLPVVLARPFNTYGPRQSTRAVIPTVITQIAAGRREIRLGDLTPTRDFNYVEDTCRGLSLLGTCEEAVGQAVNIGSNYEISIYDTVMKIKELMRSGVDIQVEDRRKRPEKSEVFRLWCDNTKINRMTGFVPRYSLDEGLKKTIEWFSDKRNLKKYRTGSYEI